MTAPAPAAPGAAFDVPGIPGGSTQWTEQDETSVQVVTQHQAAAGVQVTGILPYRQTDVVVDWFLCLAVTQAYVAGTSVLTPSAYAPFNLIGPTRQLIQNQYASVDVESGIDLYIFNLARPFDKAEATGGVNVYSNPDGAGIGGGTLGYMTAAVAQVNQINPVQWTPALASYELILRLPAAQWFDAYYDLAVTGEPVTAPHPALVSPQYMAGSTRNITPSFTINQGNAGTTDTGPVNIGAGSGTYAGSSTLRIRRRAVYAGQPVVSPPVYSWQYRWHTQRFGVGGQSRFDIMIPNETGQLLMGYVRLFDPAAAGGLGAPVNVNTITRFDLQFGGGLLKFTASTIGGTTAAMLTQRQWMAKHGNFLPPGVLAVDLAQDERGNISNNRALNTLTTAGILFHVETVAPLSASTYCVLGTESLVFVA